MQTEIRLLPKAWEDLAAIEDYYQAKFDVETALKVTGHILDCIEHLQMNPDLGVTTPDRWLNERGYRMIIAGQHVAIFRKIGMTVFIYHIADTRTDYPRLFQ